MNSMNRVFQNRMQVKVIAMRKEVHITQWYVLCICGDHNLKSHLARVRSLTFIDFLLTVHSTHDSFVEYFPDSKPLRMYFKKCINVTFIFLFSQHLDRHVLQG